jgi:hypothetical protein
MCVSEEKAADLVPRPPDAMNIVCYSPYLSWQIHATWEATMLMALLADGAQVKYLLCDGVYPICDLDTPSSPRTPLKCYKCQATQAGFLGNLPFPYHWLNRYLTNDDRAQIAGWVDELRRMSSEQLDTATFDGQPIQSWVRPSIHLMFRIERLDLNNPVLRDIFIAYLTADALAYRALGRAFDELKPDLLFVLNGMRASTRVALAVARARGIRTLCHERASLHQHVTVTENDHSCSPDVVRALWQSWKDVPLTADELRTCAGRIRGMADGTDLNWIRYSPPPGQASQLHQKLQLDPARPIWTAFTSSLDEIIGDEGYRDQAMTQNDWLFATARFAARHPEIQLVIRQHPNRPIEHKEHRPIIAALNPSEIAFQEAFVGSLPPNARFVAGASDISSYDLIEASTLGINYISTVGVEMASRGIEVVTAGRGVYRGLPFLGEVDGLQALERRYEAALQLPSGFRSSQLARQAHRFMYAWFYRWMFHLPMVDMPTLYTGSFRFRSLDELGRGQSPTLDRIRRIVFGGEPAIPLPSEAQRTRDDADEVAFFGLAPGAAASAVPELRP